MWTMKRVCDRCGGRCRIVGGKIHCQTLMVSVQAVTSNPTDFAICNRITADLALPVPLDPLTDTEMQPVVFAAKMALLDVIFARRRKRRAKLRRKEER